MRGSIFWMFQVWETAPSLLLATLTSLTVPLSFTCVILMGSKYGFEPCLRPAPALTTTTSPTLYVCGFCSVFSYLLFWRISLCFHSLMNCQSAWNETFNIASRPNTNCVGVASAVECTVEFMAFPHVARTPLKPRKESKSRLSLIWALRIMLWSVLWHLSIMEFDCGLWLVIIFRLTPYSLVRVSLTSLANSLPLSTVTSVGHECWVSQWISNQLAIVSAVF